MEMSDLMLAMALMKASDDDSRRGFKASKFGRPKKSVNCAENVQKSPNQKFVVAFRFTKHGCRLLLRRPRFFGHQWDQIKKMSDGTAKVWV